MTAADDAPGRNGLEQDLAAYVAADAARAAAAGTDPTVLDHALVPLLWMLGRWRGEGVAAGVDGEPDLAVTLEAEFTHEGGPWLRYVGRTLVGTRVLGAEAGYWRVVPGAVELVLAHPTGVVEVYVGTPASSRIELATDLVARTASAPTDTAARRLYGLVEGQLLFAVDGASGEGALRSRLSGALDKV